MDLAKKLRQVVAANFVEISRPNSRDPKPEKNPKEGSFVPAVGAAPDAPPVTPLEAEQTSPAELDKRFLSADLGLEANRPKAASLADPVGELEEPAMAVSPNAPAIPLATPSAQEAPVEALDVMAIASSEGRINFDRVFAWAGVPRSAAFTAEQALSMLQSMPADLPLRVKRLTVKATLDAVGQAVGAAPTDIVADAERKTVGLEAFTREVAARVQELCAAEDAEIERLRARIVEHEAAKMAVARHEEGAISACRAHMEELGQVVAFFTINESDAPAAPIGAEPLDDDTGELPAYLQEDAVKRLLGISRDQEVEGEGDRAYHFPKSTENRGGGTKASRLRNGSGSASSSASTEDLP
ncbi:MAG: hypothetical protein H7Z41_02470 [Cytophagales bacterium]|nr:hypothetical protein [Armatimonadota bacterium]